MRALAPLLIVWLSIVDLSVAQTAKTAPSTKLPVYRPALLGSGPGSLINRIDTQDLVKKGQKDAAIMFTCSVKKTGDVVWSGTYRGTPESGLLEQELFKRLADAKFIPAVYNHLPVDAIYYGTLTFVLLDGKPRLRIFSNQETEELKQEADFVGPQPFFGGESKFTGFHYPSTEDAPVKVDGVAELDLQIDETGVVQVIKIRNEEPPFLGFGEAALSDVRNARFIPAFRDGKPVACTVTLPIYYKRKN
jgi:TonB family protein